MRSAELVTLEGDDETFWILPDELQFFAETGTIPINVYHRNPHIKPELMGSVIANIIKGVITGATSVVSDAVKSRKARKSGEKSAAEQRALELQKAQIQAREQSKKTLALALVGLAAAGALMFAMKG